MLCATAILVSPYLISSAPGLGAGALRGAWARVSLGPRGAPVPGGTFVSLASLLPFIPCWACVEWFEGRDKIKRGIFKMKKCTKWHHPKWWLWSNQYFFMKSEILLKILHFELNNVFWELKNIDNWIEGLWDLKKNTEMLKDTACHFS